MINNLRKLRIENELSISELANLCNVTESYITKIENGGYKITKNMQKKLTKVLNVNPEDLYFKEINGIHLEPNDVTFANNKRESIHRWYPYIEGFSQGFVEEILKKHPNNVTVYDPFNGSGTTTLTCAFNNINSFYSEINPFMRFVANTKVNTVKYLIEKKKITEFYKEIKSFEHYYKSKLNNNIDIYKYINSCYKNSNYFSEKNLQQIATIKKYYLNIQNKHIQDLFALALGGILVECSNMIRSVDLRRRKNREIERIETDIYIRFSEQLNKMLNDIESIKSEKISHSYLLNTNAKEILNQYRNKMDIIITSPPYVNGTNYFRNTKLELWILDFIETDSDLKAFRTKAVTAGINNVSKEIGHIKTMDFVELYATKLDEVSKDSRIPKLIRAYFSDMYKVFNNFNQLLKLNGEIYFDIGDSQYYGVHIPVDELMSKIATLNGFEEISNKTIRNRRSKNGMLLSQKVILYKKKREVAQFGHL